MRTIHIMSGVAGCGKSRFVREHSVCGEYVLSRDDFRQDLRNKLNKPDEYFPCEEKEEWYLWTNHIIDHLKASPNVDMWIDQTTLTQKALDKLLTALAPYITANDIVQVLVFDVPLDRIKEQNAQRDGFARVPDGVVESMFTSASRNPPDFERTAYKFPEMNIAFHPIKAQG